MNAAEYGYNVEKEEIPLPKLAERWENCLRVLEALTPHERRRHWDMATFGYKTDCGTVACAAGHCALDPWFRRRGFLGDFRPSWFPGDPPSMRLNVECEDFFGEGVWHIFYDDSARPVRTVIKEVKAHIKTLRAQIAAA